MSTNVRNQPLAEFTTVLIPRECIAVTAWMGTRRMATGITALASAYTTSPSNRALGYCRVNIGFCLHTN